MNIKNKLIIKLFLTVLLVLVIVAGSGLYFVLFTSTGSQFAVRHALRANSLDHNISFESADGNLAEGIRFKHLNLKGLKELPDSSELTIEDMYLKVSSWEIDGLEIQIFNAQLKMPASDPVILSGSFTKGEIDAVLRSDRLDINEAAGYVLNRPGIKEWPGAVKKLEARIYGNYLSPAMSASLLVTGLKDLPERSELKIQDIYIKVHRFEIDGLEVYANNVRLKMPVSDPVVANGSMLEGTLGAEVYSASVDISEIAGYFPKNPHTRYLHGEVKQLDTHINGHYAAPVVTGSMMIEDADNRQVKIKESPMQFDLRFKDLSSSPQMSGVIEISSGKVISGHSSIQLEPSKLYYSGNPENPRLDLNGETMISKVNIRIGIKGMLAEPDIKLSSEPVMTQQELIVMLATGKKWEGFSESISTGNVSPALTKDFVEFMFLGGTGNKVAERFGLTNFSVNVGPDSRGIGASKQLAEGVEVNYELERETDINTTNSGTTQTLGSEIRVTNRVTLNLNKEFKNSDGTELDEKEIERAEIMLKYKKKF